MTQAPVAAKIIEQCRREGLPIPPAIANAPTLDLGLGLYLDAFWELSSCRAAGFTLGPIPWTAISDYAECYGLSEEQTEDLIFHVRALDNVYIEHHKPKKKGGGREWRSPTTSGSSQGGWPSARRK